MRALTCALALAALASVALAQEAPLKDFTARQLVDRLAPKGVKLRGLSVTPTTRQQEHVDIDVNFTYNSATLTDEARHVLAVVAEAFRSDELKDHSFRLAGYTDARGSSGYNQTLSEARAESVKRYLTGQQGIAPWRLVTVGYGETHLLFPDMPDDGRNRRVEITTLN